MTPFRRFWLGQTISFLGSEVTSLALPLTAVILLHATPAQMGWLTTARTLPFLVFGLMAGVWVDRLRRRPILIASDLANAALLGSIPAAAALGWLGMPHLYVVSFVTGSIFVVAMVAYQSFVPSLVDRGELVAANSRLEVSSSVAGIAGPGLGGLLVQWLTAPIAILVDALSFVVSAGFLATVRAAEPAAAVQRRQGNRQLIAEGLHLVRDDAVLRGIVSAGTFHNFFSRMIDALYVLYLVDGLGLDAGRVGAIAAVGGVGALVGALAASPAARRLGVGPACIWAQALTGAARLCVPLAGGSPAVTMGALALGEFLLGAARPIFNVNQVSLRLSITPEHQHGRVNATMRFVMWSVTPFGAALGGLVASTIGLRPTLFVAATGVLLATVLAWASPLRHLARVPEPA